MAAAAILKNRKIAILEGFELISINCNKSNALTTRLSVQQIATPVCYLCILSCMTMQYIYIVQ